MVFNFKFNFFLANHSYHPSKYLYYVFEYGGNGNDAFIIIFGGAGGLVGIYDYYELVRVNGKLLRLSEDVGIVRFRD